MPSLPTLNIADQVKWDRVFAAFNGSPTEYKAWLREAVRAEVERREVSAISASADAQYQAKAAELAGYLDSAT
jgi:hypothetical protein